MVLKNKKAEFTFSNYLVGMFLILGLLGVFSGLTSSLMVNYETNTSVTFENYLEQFDSNKYQDENTLNVDSSSSDSGEFSEYESSFQFGEQVSQTKNQTGAFISATGEVLGVPSIVWYIITGVIFILLAVVVVYFLRGLNEK